MVVVATSRRLTGPFGVAPGFNQNHIAAYGVRASIVANNPSSVNMFNLIGAKTGTVTGGAVGIDENLGSYTFFSGATGKITFAGQSTVNDATQTIAAFVIFTTIAAGVKTPFSNTSTVSTGYTLQVSAADPRVNAGGTILDSGLTLVANTPYFLAVSIKSGATNFLTRNLTSGVTRTANITTAYTAVAPDGTYIVCNAPTGAAANCKIAAVMNSSAYLSLNQLIQWSNDPWSFWYPNLFSNQLAGLWSQLDEQGTTNTPAIFRGNEILGY